MFYAVLGTDLILLPVTFILGFKALEVSPLSLKKNLSASQGVVSQSPDLKNYLDCTGRSITTLRPSGTALIDGARLDVVTDGEFIEADAPLRVCKVTGNQVIVCRRDNI
jgi:membrane-bound serine protease (ClpP class)